MSIGTTNAILALLGKVEVLILLLMATENHLANMPDANLTSLAYILSIPGIFLEFRDFMMAFTIATPANKMTWVLKTVKTMI